MRKLLSALIALWLANIVAFAAPGAFTSVGTVVDEVNEPVTGATVSVAGGKALGVTDIDGKFKVQVPGGTRADRQLYRLPYLPAPIWVPSSWKLNRSCWPMWW